MSAPLLEAINLNKSYLQRTGALGLETKRVQALHNVSLQMQAGKTLAIVGESGSGKSTLAKCILKLHSLDSGSVFFNGEDLSEVSASRLRQLRKEMQMVFQDPFASLNPRLRVGAIVEEGLLIHGIGDQSSRRVQTIEMLERVGLSAADAEKYPHQFSGGQRQRIGIARALIMRPKLVICDEPVSALDVSIQAQILLLLKELQQEMQLSYLFITHDLRVVRHIADDVAVMQHGRVVEQGAVDSLYSQPKEVYTQNLLRSIPGRKIA